MAMTERTNGSKPVVRRSGRKPAIQHSPETQDRFVTAIKAGNYAVVAAQFAGIHVATYHRYMQLGSEQTKGVYRDFHDAVKAAEAEAEARAVANVQLAAQQGQWTASAWMLERKHPDRWGRRDRREITGADGAPIEIAANVDIRAVVGRIEEMLALEAGTDDE
jgi:hypothetical protein